MVCNVFAKRTKSKKKKWQTFCKSGDACAFHPFHYCWMDGDWRLMRWLLSINAFIYHLIKMMLPMTKCVRIFTVQNSIRKWSTHSTACLLILVCISYHIVMIMVQTTKGNSIHLFSPAPSPFQVLKCAICHVA